MKHRLARRYCQKCELCNKEFWTVKDGARYCSDACRIKAFRTRQREQLKAQRETWQMEEQQLIAELTPYFGDDAETVYNALQRLICVQKRDEWLERIKDIKTVIDAAMGSKMTKVTQMLEDAVLVNKDDYFDAMALYDRTRFGS